MDSLRKVFTSEIKAIDEREMTMTAYISTDTIDRMREVLDPAGVDISNYRKNPIVLWAHNYNEPPIGKALWVKRDGNGILSKLKFASTAFAQEIFQLYKEGFLKAFSVGFIPKEKEWGKEEDKDNPKKPRLTYKKWELLEYSAVPVPANPDALALAIQKGLCKIESIKESIEKGWEQEEDWEEETNKKEIEEKLKETEKQNQEKRETGLEDLQAENKLLQERICYLEKENIDLKFQLYQYYNKKQKTIPEITVDNLANKVVEVVNGVIRKAQGKID